MAALLLLAGTVYAQDNCATAVSIPLGAGNFGTGVFTSAQLSLNGATLQTGEFLHNTQVSAGTDKKSVWYKFTLPTARAVNLQLKQPATLIPEDAVGFTLYKSGACLPTAAQILDAKLTPLNKFGSSYNPCLAPGDYLVQITSKAFVVDNIFVDLTIGMPGILNQYDLKTTAQNIGTLSGNRSYTFDVGCQTIDDATETCATLTNPTEYTQSTWHTFTTDSWVDAVRIQLGVNGTWDAVTRRFGIRIYQGAPTGALVEVVPCTEMVQNGYTNPYIDLKCSLTNSTQYTVQFFFDKDDQFTARLDLYEIGSGNTTGFDPLALPAANSFGLVPTSVAGTTTTRTDRLSCNSRLSLAAAPCANTVMPAAGVGAYELSTWFRFQVNAGNNIRLDPSAGGSCASVRVRLYSSASAYMASCDPLDVTLYDDFVGGKTLNCLPAGYYLAQILGDDTDIPGCQNHLGRTVQLSITSTQVNVSNNFDLATGARYDNVNGGANMPLNVTIPSTFDRFGCNNTVMPSGDVCGGGNTKAVYRRIVIGQNGILRVSGGNWQYFSYRLYRGDAVALATAQGADVAGEVITGLSDQAGCQSTYWPFEVCVTPGVYTLVSFGDGNDVGIGDQPSFYLSAPVTTYGNPAAPNNLGTIAANTSGATDYWSCVDNPLTIAGRTPCGSANKQIYRTFYLSTPRLVTLSSNYSFRLFTGRSSDGIGTLLPYTDAYIGEWSCRGSTSTHPCGPLPAGWYTVVQYGSGKTYVSPPYTSGLGDDIGDAVSFSISLNSGPNSPQYNRPAIACQANSGNPLTWSNTGTAAIPNTGKSYTLCTEYFNCTNDLPFAAHPIAGCAGYNRTAYYTFSLSQQAYVNVRNVSNSFRVQIYSGDARTTPAILNNPPIQPCVQMYNSWPWWNGNFHDGVELCNAQPGTYTMVIFATDAHIGSSVTPTIYVDESVTSRFDHASLAYDFGVLPRNNTEYYGKVDDPLAATPVEESHPTVPGRKASSDIFYCTTGAQPNDPKDLSTEGAGGDNTKCDQGSYQNPVASSVPYPMANTHVVYDNDAQTLPVTRRTLWYTFVADGPGRIYVKVYNRTTGKTQQAPFSVYMSNVDGNLDFATLQASSGAMGVDSTVALGLTFVDNSYNHNSWWWCTHNNTVQFDRNPCTVTGKTRYYVVVDNPGYIYPTSQIDVSVRHEPYTPLPLEHDFCSGNVDPNLNADDLGTLGAGVVVGDTSSFACATRSVTDPNACGQRTLWYTFESTISGRMRVNYEVFPTNQVLFSDNEIQVYKASCGGATAANKVNMTSMSANGQNWGEGCLSPGRYILVLTGCSYTIEQAAPRVWLVPQQGDLCSASDPAAGAVDINLAPAVGVNASATVAVNIDCHTIGEGFGEDGSNMGCLFGPTNYKTTWFKLNLTASEKVDLSFQLSENTTALPNQIRYRVLYGTCDAMSAGPCNSDALTEFTLNCMQGGDYYVQVALPASATGNLSLTARTSPTPNQTCLPLDPLVPVVNFTVAGGCVNEAVSFTNYSSQGDDISYLWEFGDAGNTTSTDFVPNFTYTSTGTYNVRLTVTNSGQAPPTQAYVDIPVTIYAKPTGSITVASPAPSGTQGSCEVIVANSPYTFNSNATNAVSYYWDFASGGTSTMQNPTNVSFTQEGSNAVTLILTNGTCTNTITDCIVAGLEPIFNGGPYDGASRVVGTYCPAMVVYNGGPYDGATFAQSNSCPTQVVYNGGPYDGAARAANTSCPTEVVYNGGPYDGAARAFTLTCPETVVYNGGPYDGAARAAAGPMLDTIPPSSYTVCSGTSVTLDLTLAPGAGTAVGYLWSTTATTASITVAPTTTTVYTGRLIFDYPAPSGCRDTLLNSYTVMVLPGPVADAGTGATFCDNGSATLGIAAVTGYTYSWAPATGLSATNVAQPTATVSSTTTYTLTVTNPNLTGACATATDNVTLTVLSPPTITAGPDQLVCPSGTATITASVSAGAGYEWYTLNPTTFAITGTLGTAASYDVAAGWYAVRATNAACQSDTQRIWVRQQDLTTLDYRSRQNGDWNTLTTWQVKDPVTGTWVNAEDFNTCGTIPYPTAQSDSVLVRHRVVYNVGYNTAGAYSATNNPYGIDQTTISNTGILVIPTGYELGVVDQGTYDLQNQGRLEIEGTFTVTGAGLLENTDNSTVAYTRNGDQTMWNGTYGNLEVTGSGNKTVGGSSTIVRTGVQFLGAWIVLGNNNITLWDNANVTGYGLSSGYFVTNQFGAVVKNAIGSSGFFFPVGHSTTNYNPLQVQNDGTTDNYSLRVEPNFINDLAFPGDDLTELSAVDRTWHLNEAVPGGSNLTVTTYWITADQNASFDPTASANGAFDPGAGWTRFGILQPATGSGTTADMYSQTGAGLVVPGPISVGSCAISPLDYRTIADGNWTDVNIWEVWDTGTSTWISASFVNTTCGLVQYPTALSRYVDVRHKVVYNYSIPMGIDQVVVRSDAQITVPYGVSMRMAYGSMNASSVVSTSLPPNSATLISNTDIYNMGTIVVTGEFAAMGNAQLNNDDNSLVHYNGNDQTMWAGKYGRLQVSSMSPSVPSLKTVGAAGTRVNTGLVFSGAKILLGTENVTMAHAATVTGASQLGGYMVATDNGFCVWEYAAGTLVQHNFPLGGDEYSPCIIRFDNVTTPGTLLGRVREYKHPTLSNPISRFWTLEKGTIDFMGSYVGTFNYHDVDLPYVPQSPSEELQMVIIGGAYSPLYTQPNNWRLSPTDVAVAHDVTNNLGFITNDAFSDFTFMPIFEPILPVANLMLTGKWEGRDAQLNWRVDSETNAYGYTLQRSADGAAWTSVTWRDAVGTTSQPVAYGHLDTEVAPMTLPHYYYRVLQQDLDGRLTYSNTVLLSRAETALEGEAIRLYPNPVAGGQQLSLLLQLEKAERVEIVVYDVLGKRLYAEKVQANAGQNLYSLPLGRLAAGHYHVQVVTAQQVHSQRLIVLDK